MTPEQRHCYQTFHDVLSLDTKYRVNRYAKPFASIVTESSYGTTLILAQAVLVDETTESFEWLFRCLLQPIETPPETIFTDGDAAIASTRQRLCQWHLHKNVLKILSWMGRRLKERWHKVMHEDNILSLQDFDSQWKMLLKDFELDDASETHPDVQRHQTLSDFVER